MVSAVVFDLDGTLIDSAPDLHGAAVRLLKGEDRPPLDLATIRSFVGNGVPTLVRRVMAASDIDVANHTRLMRIFIEDYQARSTELTTLYPGVLDSLAALQADGHALGICTNKPETPSRVILDAFGLTDIFGVVIGGDTLPVHKPDPAPLEAAFAQLGATHRLFVGDSEVDADTAVALGAPFALYTEGYRKTAVGQIPHQVRFSDYADLARLAARVFSGGIVA